MRASKKLTVSYISARVTDRVDMSKYPLFPPPPSGKPLPINSLHSSTSKRKWYQKKRWQLGGSAFGLLLFISALTDDPVDEPLPNDNLAFVDTTQAIITAKPSAATETTIESKATTQASTTAKPTTSKSIATTARPTTTVSSTTTSTEVPVTIAPPATQVSFSNCDAVRAAGKAPIRIGDPGYGGHLDRDNDGIGCEVN